MREDTMPLRHAPTCGCATNGHIIRGMCRTHYDRWVHATPKDKRSTPPRQDRDFSDFVNKTESCWLWTGPTNNKGYGWWSGGGERGLAHRRALAETTPEPRAGMMACHRCDNPPCVNPDHLYWGTALDNGRDLSERGTPKNQNTGRTHCIRGHELSGSNLRIVGRDQRRQCRQCDNERSRIKMATRRARARGMVST